MDGNRQEESRILRSAYQRQNELFFGGLAVLFALIVIGSLLYSGVTAGMQKRRSGYLTGSWGSHEINQELLDYLSDIPGVYAATPVLKTQATLKLGKYRWSGEVCGIDFKGAGFLYQDVQRKELDSEASGIILGKNALDGFNRTDELQIDDTEKYLLEQQLLSGLVTAGLADTEMAVPAAKETADNGLTGLGKGDGTAEPGTAAGVDQQSENSIDEANEGHDSGAEEPAEAYNWQVEGIIADSHKEVDEAVFIDRAQLKELIQQRGVQAEVHNILIKVRHIQDIPDIIAELERVELSCTNVYQADLDKYSEQQKDSRRYLYMSILVLIFAVYYIKSILSPPIQAPERIHMHNME